jgi:hypothetical protein
MCRLFKILVAAVPFRSWKSAIVRRHLGRCERCAEALKAGDRAIASALKPDWIAGGPSLWPGVQEKIDAAEFSSRLPEALSQTHLRRSLRIARRWALAASISACLAAVVIVWVVVGRPDRRPWGAGLTPSGRPVVVPASAPRVQIISAEVGGKRAKTYIYQTPKGSFIWIAPQKEIGG